MLNTVLAVDIGTSSLKAGLFTASGEDVFVWRQKYNSHENPNISQKWLETLATALKKIQQAVPRLNLHGETEINVIALSISGNGPTLVIENSVTYSWNEPLAPRVENALKNRQLPESACKSLFLPRILSLKEKFPAEFDSAKYIFSGPEFLIYKLTGSAVTILPEARYTTAYWTTESLTENALPTQKFAPFAAPGQIYGLVTKDMARKLPLLKEGLPVYGAGPDFIAALIGTGTVESGQLCDRSGSSEGINFCVNKPIFAPGIRTLPSVKPGLWNISVLIPDSSKLNDDERLDILENGVNLLRKLAAENQIPFPSEMRVTGGQTNDKAFLQKKANRLHLKLIINHCKHSELLGDAKIVWQNYENL